MAISSFNEDLRYIAANNEIPWQQLTNGVVLVTGATGLVGSALIRALATINSHHGLSMRIIAHGRNEAKGKALVDDCGVDFVGCDICELPLKLSDIERMDYMFHCAAITKSADMVAKPVGVMVTSVDGTKNMLELAKERNCKGFVYLSSMEVYGQISKPDQVRETDLGYLDLSSPRTSYPESKRFCESLCVAYASQYGLPTRIARLAMTFGAGTPNDETNTRAPMQFARKALAGEDIVLHTLGDSVLNCCYTADAISALFFILLKGSNGQAYNIANPAATITVKGMAEIVAQTLSNGKSSVKIQIPEDIDKHGYAPKATMILNVDKLKALGWLPRYDLADMYRRMVSDW